MNDDDKNAMLWTARPPAPRQRRPGELLWTVRKDDVTWTSELKFHGKSYGWESITLRDGDLAISRRFLLREGALRWAEEEKQYREKGGA